MTRATHTLALLEIEPSAYEQVAAALREAGWAHALLPGGVIDMTGVGLVRGEPRPVVMALNGGVGG